MDIKEVIEVLPLIAAWGTNMENRVDATLEFKALSQLYTASPLLLKEAINFAEDWQKGMIERNDSGVSKANPAHPTNRLQRVRILKCAFCD